MKYIDTHAHLIGSYFKEDPIAALKLARENNVEKIILPGTTAKDSKMNIDFAKKHEGIYAMAGIHPADSNDYDSSYLSEIDPDDIVAVGEIGLDFYHESNPSSDVQKSCFIDHLEFALKHNKPVVIHMRDAEELMLEILTKYVEKGLKILLHCYSSTLSWAKKFIALGITISFSGIVTFKNAQEVKEVAKKVPDHLIVAETDSPFLAPVPHRGKTNQPAYVKNVVDYLIELRNDKDLGEKIYQNSINFFKL